MKSKKLILGIILSFGFISGLGLILSNYPAAHSQEAVSQDYTISIPEPLVRQADSKVYYEIKGFGANAVLGQPILPYKTYYYEIPANAKDISVSLVNTVSRSLGTISNLVVFQGVAPMDEPKLITSDSVAARPIYKEATFPAQAFKYLGENGIKGHRLVCVGISPLIFNIATNELTFNSSYTIKITYTLDDTLVSLVRQMEAKKSPVFEKTAQEIISNYQGVQEVEALEGAAGIQIVSLAPVANMRIKYAIITLPENAAYLQPLADWKTKKGVPTKVYTTDWIEANYTGADLQEKIKRFLTGDSPNYPYNPFYYANFDWLLIAGEQGGGMPYHPPTEGVKLPSRYVGATGHIWYTGDEDLVPADYYYADCAGDSVADSYIYDWDTNDDGIYGWLDDDIKWIPDTYVGRIPSNESTKLTQMVDKIIAYEKNPTAGTWVNETVLCGGKADDYTDSALLMQFIKDDVLDPAGLTNFRLNYLTTYPREAELNESNFISYVSPGRTLVQWSAHGNNIKSTLYSGGAHFVRGDVTNITCGNKRPVVYSSACRNGVFDYHYPEEPPTVNHYYTLGDSLLFGYGKPDWGIAFIGAARTVYYWIGWNSPALGGSHGEQYRFNQQVFQQGKYHLGQAFYDMKLQMVNDFDGSPNYDPDTVASFRKNLFAMNLLGDPEMEIWTAEPQQFNVTIAPYVWRNYNYSVWVKDGNGLPISGALVASYKPGDAYATSLTDANGQVIFKASTKTTGSIQVTVTKHNFIPAETSISVQEHYGGGSHWSCPYLYLWNGNDFEKDNDILPAGNPMHYRDYYKLMKPLAARDNKYLIKIVDSEDETSWIDMVKLIQIDHPQGISVAPTPEGEILTYTKPQSPIAAVDLKKQSQLAKIANIDNSEEGSYYGEKGDALIVNFGSYKDKGDGARLLLRTDLKCPKDWYLPTPSIQSLHVSVLLQGKKWQEIGVVHPHQSWDEWALPIASKYLDKIKGELKVKIEWTQAHRLDFVGLDTSKQVPVILSELPLLKALHSQKGDVLGVIKSPDKKSAVTVQDQLIDLEFSALSTPTASRSFIFISEGSYKANKR